MNRYQFAKVTATTFTDKEIRSARTLTNTAEILNVSKSIGEYVFTANEELNKYFRAFKDMEIVLETLPNGSDVNRVKAKKGNDDYRLRLYGAKNAILAPRDLSDSEIASADFGYCTSGGEIVTESKVVNGELVNVPRIYIKLA